MLDDKEIFDSLVVLNNIARSALVNGDAGEARNKAAGILDQALKERIEWRNELGVAYEEIELLKKEG